MTLHKVISDLKQTYCVHCDVSTQIYYKFHGYFQRKKFKFLFNMIKNFHDTLLIKHD